MQKLIAKYGLAAHLAILAVAPLFLFPFAGVKAVVVTLLWLSLVAACWTIFEPSVLRGEHLHEARCRILREIGRDPLFWLMAGVVLMTGLRALNTGVALAYDAEEAKWHMAQAVLSFLPGSVDRSGDLPFAAALSVTVLLSACRHAMGRSARMSFLLLASSLSGVASIVLHVAVNMGCPTAMSFVSRTTAAFSFVGFSFGVYFLAGLVGLFAVSENDWNKLLLLPVAAIGGNGAGVFSCAPVYQSASFSLAFAVLAAYVVFYSKWSLRASGKFKLALIGLTAIVLGGLLVLSSRSQAVLAEYQVAFQRQTPFPERFWEVRSMLSGISFRSWVSHLWIGAGVGAFPLCFRFGAHASDWTLLPSGAAAVSNGWWQVLAERGVIGLVLVVVPAGFLLFTYGRRLYGSFRDWEIPHPSCLLAPLLLTLSVALGFFDCSFMRIEALMAVGALLSVSAASFPKRRQVKHV